MTELLGAVPPLGNATAHFPTIVHPRQPSRIWADASSPLLTNEWWQDLVLEESGANAVTTLPFIVRARADGLHVGLPDDGRRTVAERYVIADLAEDWSFGAAEGLGPRRVVGHDALSVTLRWSGGVNGTMRTPLVRGMAYASAQYASLTPKLTCAVPIASLADAAGTGRRFELRLADGQTWLLYASSRLELTYAPGGWVASPHLVAASPYHGWLRLARAGGPRAG